jgi:hypothetical protein
VSEKSCWKRVKVPLTPFRRRTPDSGLGSHSSAACSAANCKVRRRWAWKRSTYPLTRLSWRATTFAAIVHPTRCGPTVGVRRRMRPFHTRQSSQAGDSGWAFTRATARPMLRLRAHVAVRHGWGAAGR